MSSSIHDRSNEDAQQVRQTDAVRGRALLVDGYEEAEEEADDEGEERTTSTTSTTKMRAAPRAQAKADRGGAQAKVDE